MEEDWDAELHRQSTAQKVQAQLKQILQDEGVGATFTEEQATELILQVTCPFSLFPSCCHSLMIVTDSRYVIFFLISPGTSQN